MFLQHRVGLVEGSSHAKTSSIRSFDSIELPLVTERHRHHPTQTPCLAVKHDVIHKTGGTQRNATTSEEDRATGK